MSELCLIIRISSNDGKQDIVEVKPLKNLKDQTIQDLVDLGVELNKVTTDSTIRIRMGSVRNELVAKRTFMIDKGESMYA